MDALSAPKANVLRAGIHFVDKNIRAGVTLQRAKAQDKHWVRWNQFCLNNAIDPFLRCWEDPIPILQVFGHCYRDGRLATGKKPIRARAVEDALCVVDQAFTRVGSTYVRKDLRGNIDFRIQCQIRAYK
jgi:hypothetical protein